MQTVRVVRQGAGGFGSPGPMEDRILRLRKGPRPPEGSQIVEVLPDETPERDWRPVGAPEEK